MNNKLRLAIQKMSTDAIPAGGGFADGAAFLADSRKMRDGFGAALAWTQEAIALVRSAAEPNPWKDADDETIAAEILNRVAKRRERTP